MTEKHLLRNFPHHHYFSNSPGVVGFKIRPRGRSSFPLSVQVRSSVHYISTELHLQQRGCYWWRSSLGGNNDNPWAPNVMKLMPFVTVTGIIPSQSKNVRFELHAALIHVSLHHHAVAHSLTLMTHSAHVKSKKRPACFKRGDHHCPISRLAWRWNNTSTRGHHSESTFTLKQFHRERQSRDGGLCRH